MRIQEKFNTVLASVHLYALLNRMPAVMVHSGVATGWTGVDMSTPVFPEFDFLISRNPLKKLWGGGVDFHSLRTFISFS